MRAYVVAAALGLAAVWAGASGSTPGPTVWLAQASPLVVVGSGFTPGTPVRVSYGSGAVQRQRPVVVSANGRLRAVFAGVGFQRCRGAEVEAGAAALVVRPCNVPGGRPSIAAPRVGLVRGSAFLPYERVVVVGRLSGEQQAAQAVSAAADGTFVISLPLRATACAEAFYRAQGALGSTATVTLSAPACKPA